MESGNTLFRINFLGSMGPTLSGKKHMKEMKMTPKEIKEKGLLIIYTGEGKGKTTAALGMVYRALGWNHKVAVIQFLKGKWKTGDRKFAATLVQLNFSTMG